MPERFVTIASFLSPVEAHLAKNRLEENGIKVGLMGDPSLSAFGVLGGAGGAITLQVAESDRSRAAAVLEQYQSENEPVPDELRLAPLEALDQPEAIRPASFAARETTEFTSDVQTSGVPTVPKTEELLDTGESGAVVDDTVIEELQTSVGDSRADGAWKFSVVGLLTTPFPFCHPCFFFFPIFHLISGVLIVSIALQQHELSAVGRRKMYGALLIDGLALVGWAIYVRIYVLPAWLG